MARRGSDASLGLPLVGVARRGVGASWAWRFFEMVGVVPRGGGAAGRSVTRLWRKLLVVTMTQKEKII